MAYATKYSVTFKDVEDVEWVINFQEDGFGGAATTLTPGADPLILTWNQSDKYQPIIGSTADIQLVYESAIDSLYTEDSQGIRVYITKAGGGHWYGFLSPGQYFRQFNKPVHYVTLTASDGLGELKGIKFEDSGDPYYYTQTEAVVLANILLKTGLSLSIYEAINIFEDGYTATASDSPLLQTYIYQEQYWDEITDDRGDCYEVLTDILKKYGATIRQNTTYWRIYRPNDFSVSENIYYRVLTSAGVYSSNSSHATETTIGATNYYIHADQEITKVAGVGSSEVTLEPIPRPNGLKNGSFESFTWSGGNPRYWTNSGATYNNTADTAAITIGSNGSASAPTNYLYARQYFYNAKSIRLTLEYKCVYTGTPTHAKVDVGLIVNGNYFAPSADTWSTSAYHTTSAVAYDLIADSKASMSDYETLVVAPTSGPYTSVEGGYGEFNWVDIRLYELHNETGGTSNYIQYRQIFLEVEYDGIVPRKEIYTFDGPNSLNMIHKEHIRVGDSLIADRTYDDMFYGITGDSADFASNLTDVWYIKGDNPTVTTEVPIAELLAKQYTEGYTHGLDLLRGSIRSAYTHLPHLALEDSDFTDDYGYVKRYYPRGISYDARHNEYNGEWIECPATYTDEAMEWDSCIAPSYTITANELEVDSYSAVGGAFADFDSYTAVAGETIRLHYNIVDDGSSNTPYVIVDSVAQSTRSWGDNYYTIYFATAGVKTIELGAAGHDERQQA